MPPPAGQRRRFLTGERGLRSPVAQDRVWTIAVAKGLAAGGYADLVLITPYASTLVPVPTGVGPNAPIALQN